eukprot:1789609-Lingulodinium_polyedra.AAC.1
MPSPRSAAPAAPTCGSCSSCNAQEAAQPRAPCRDATPCQSTGLRTKMVRAMGRSVSKGRR